ncbi:MAG: WD40 repeat domain-containing protein [Verrucomicrobiia bacterium]
MAPNRVVSGDIDGNVLLWKWQPGEGPVAGEKFDHLFQHRGGVHRIRLSPDGRQLLTASYGKRAQLLDSETGEPIGVPFEHTGALKSLAFGEAGRVLTFCEADGAREWQTAPGSLKASLQQEAQAERAIFSSDAKYIQAYAPPGAILVRGEL